MTGMRIRNFQARFYLYAGLALACVLGGASGAMAQGAADSDQQFEQLIRSVEGPDLYRAYCASCHGIDGKGHGPAAAALKATVPDLTLLSRNSRGEFPAKLVRNTITGEDMLAVHGSREMPIWGPIFHQVEADVDRGNVRVYNLVNYLASIQATPAIKEEGGKKVSAADVPSGEQLYKKLCAACHGNDLKGNGPAPYPFKDVTPDLTTLARRHGGKFPDAYFADVLRHGVTLPDHGPAEMPTWGTDFEAGKELDEMQVTLRITNLSVYIKSQQTK
jgi:mono/diheme cytochrome c family protein